MSRTGEMTEYLPRRRKTVRLDGQARRRVLARVLEEGALDGLMPELQAERSAGQVVAVGDRALKRGTPKADRHLPRVVDLWNDMAHIPVDEALLDSNLVITATRTDPAHAHFEVLRARIVKALADNNWKRVAVTSPTDGCGKTFTAVNLAIALSRYESCRTVLMDMNLRRAGDVARMLGARQAGSMAGFLRGQRALESSLMRMGQNLLRIGPNLAIGLNDREDSYAAEILAHPDSARVLDRMMEDLGPDFVIHDLPSVLSHDDVLTFRRQYDAVLLVSNGALTSADDLSETMRRLGDDTPVLGVVLNRGEP
ncbi:CpsD/CapB family tyrosine-protein kinase [Seohaeicola saemankumensis]|uniref:CpsD/CapB family tyrosine-protein kinase n=1 Tax=Seohaeicola saemankumensis TaxID=481181 RepID=UPI001E632FC5|nr:CpsD/CapB family tyrosine-protein kinase [Seohaeicola saemankumensis]MCD1627364.1 CpsD/CapB family tyrosine-protein kinase [Seohaeicola saemankumensis]